MPAPSTPRRPGDGHTKVFASGGRGRFARQDAGAGDWWVHDALTSVPRLRLITWLCLHPGEHTGREITRALGLPWQSVNQYLMAMQWCMLVSSSWLPGHYDPGAKIGTPSHYGWAVTDAGRRFLWQYGWVTGRLVPNAWDASAHLEDTAEDPCDALARHASNAFARPMSMALADLLWQLGPVSVGRLVGALGIQRQILKTPLDVWRRAGWAEAARRQQGYRRWPLPGRNPLRWRFNRQGLAAMQNHCHAVCWAARHSGYTPPPDDPVLLDQDREWLALAWADSPE